MLLIYTQPEYINLRFFSATPKHLDYHVILICYRTIPCINILSNYALI